MSLQTYPRFGPSKINSDPPKNMFKFRLCPRLSETSTRPTFSSFNLYVHISISHSMCHLCVFLHTDRYYTQDFYSKFTKQGFVYLKSTNMSYSSYIYYILTYKLSQILNRAWNTQSVLVLCVLRCVSQIKCFCDNLTTMLLN